MPSFSAFDALPETFMAVGVIVVGVVMWVVFRKK